MCGRLPLYLTIIFVIVICVNTGLCEPDPDQELKTGTIKGRIVDLETKASLTGASVQISGTTKGAKVDVSGEYTISNVEVGSYTLLFSLIGYESKFKTDVIVRPKRITFVNAELKVSAVEAGEMVVTAGYFANTDDQPNSVVNYSFEEIRRAAGSAGDVSRIMMTLPSIGKVNDQINSLIVRGGSPIENGFFVDNIEVPNINHYPTQGSTGGPIGLINVDFIQDATFSSGGFSSAYGDKLSSIMEISFREGNREEFDAQLDLNFAGVGAIVEGPVPGNRGSYLVSIRKSYLDLLVDAIGTGVAPVYSDYQGKLTYDIGPQDKLTIIEVLGLDFIEFTKDQSIDDGNIVYGSTDIDENAVGVNWRHLWGKNGFSNTSISNMYTRYKNNFYETRTDTLLSSGKSIETSFSLRNSNHWRLNKANHLDIGFTVKYLSIDNDHFFAEYTDVFGNIIPPVIQDDVLSGYKAGIFLNYKLSPLERLTGNFGMRADYFSINKNTQFSPRFSMSYRVTEKMTINGSTGIYYQNLPMSMLAYPEENQNLKDPKAYHYVLGMNYMLSENTRLIVEAYDKQYRNFPLDPMQPSLFITDELYYRYGFFFAHENLQDEGRARAYGIEFHIQKKLAQKLYGLIGGSYFRARYRDLDNIWRDRVFDNRYVFSIEGGYKPNNRWEYSIRWILGGGAPYTPLDEVASATLRRAVFDGTRINESRYPDYHSLNVRVDRRFHFKGSNLVIYFSVWNAYNRKNIASYYWNEVENKQDVMYQWSTLPVFGFEYEF